jgi:uncharacterized protein (DUF58 family)
MKTPMEKSRTLRRDAQRAIIDLPALTVAAQRAADHVAHGEHALRKTGAGEKFWQFREYVPGDRPQDVDWRQSGKGDHVYIRQKERQSAQSVLFWCSRGPGMAFKSSNALYSKGDAAKILTLALAILAVRGGEQAGLLSTARTGRSEAMLDLIANSLCDENIDPSDLPDFSGNALRQNSTLIQAGDFLSPLADIEKTFKPLAGQTQGGFVIQVLDPAEIDLPYNGRMIFETPAGQHRTLINNVTAIREGYRKRIIDHNEGLRDLCRQCRWNYLLHRTDRPAEETLGLAWQAMHLNAASAFGSRQ